MNYFIDYVYRIIIHYVKQNLINFKFQIEKLICHLLYLTMIFK